MDSDPGSLRERIEAATGLLNATAAAMTDDQARERSLLPGWSRGHVLTHLARNADGLRNLLIWARTGVETPQCPSRFVADELELVIERFTGRDDVPACVLEVTDTGRQIRVGPAAAADARPR
jgi:hypothetical protein